MGSLATFMELGMAILRQRVLEPGKSSWNQSDIPRTETREVGAT